MVVFYRQKRNQDKLDDYTTRFIQQFISKNHSKGEEDAIFNILFREKAGCPNDNILDEVKGSLKNIKDSEMP